MTCLLPCYVMYVVWRVMSRTMSWPIRSCHVGIGPLRLILMLFNNMLHVTKTCHKNSFCDMTGRDIPQVYPDRIWVMTSMNTTSGIGPYECTGIGPYECTTRRSGYLADRYKYPGEILPVGSIISRRDVHLKCKWSKCSVIEVQPTKCFSCHDATNHTNTDRVRCW